MKEIHATSFMFRYCRVYIRAESKSKAERLARELYNFSRSGDSIDEEEQDAETSPTDRSDESSSVSTDRGSPRG